MWARRLMVRRTCEGESTAYVLQNTANSWPCPLMTLTEWKRIMTRLQEGSLKAKWNRPKKFWRSTCMRWRRSRTTLITKVRENTTPIRICIAHSSSVRSQVSTAWLHSNRLRKSYRLKNQLQISKANWLDLWLLFHLSKSQTSPNFQIVRPSRSKMSNWIKLGSHWCRSSYQLITSPRWRLRETSSKKSWGKWFQNKSAFIQYQTKSKTSMPKHNPALC